MHNFSYDPSKAEANLRKHGVSFAEAQDALSDPLGITESAWDAVGEHRFVTMGLGSSGALLVVVYTERDGDFRLISARKASRKERKTYEG